MDMLLHAGDVVGYNPFPNEVIEVFQREGIHSILGNHDRAVLAGGDYWFNSVAAAALQWTREHLKPSSFAFLRGLEPRMSLAVGDHRLLLVHGSPEDDDEYVYEGDLWDDIIPDGFDHLVMGHTHIPLFRRVPSGLVLNPGGVGQPRDGDPRASYCILDPEVGEPEFVRVGYSVEETQGAIEAAGLPRVLGERLALGI